MSDRSTPLRFHTQRLTAVLAVCALLTPLAAAEIDLRFLGHVELPTGTLFRGVEVGGLSGITYDPRQDRFLAISDDRGERASARYFTLRIDLSDGALDHDDVEVTGVTTLLDEDGTPFAKGSVDLEGIALAPDGSLYVSSEGSSRAGTSPFLRQMATDGRHLGQLPMPERYLPVDGERIGVRPNQAFESVTVTPNGAVLFAATESALLQDGPAASATRGSPVRLIRYDLARRHPDAEYLYHVDPAGARRGGGNGYNGNGLTDLHALDDLHLLAVERGLNLEVGIRSRIYLAALQGATDIRRIESLRTVDTRTIGPVRKHLVFDLASLGIPLDNLEGMTLGPTLGDGSRSLILISDNNFKASQTTQILAFAARGLEGVRGVDDARGQDEASSETSVRIHDIQGAGHLSPLLGERLTDVPGVVTALAHRGDFWIQDATGDGDVATSEAVLVSPRKGMPEVEPGDAVLVNGTVTEIGRANALTTTVLDRATFTVESSAGQLPAPVLLGQDGRLPPDGWVDDDGLAVFDPEIDAIDFFESLEGMRVRIEAGLVVGPTAAFGELTVLAEPGGAPHPRTIRGGLLLTETDSNPERLRLVAPRPPQLAVGDRLNAPVTGIIAYAFEGYRLVSAQPITSVERTAPTPEATDLAAAPHQLTVATFNLHNISSINREAKLPEVARIITQALRAPDIVALQEVQDDSGPEKDGVVTAEATLEALTASISELGGPTYLHRQVDPQDGQDGGQPGANIRVVLLFNPDRVTFVDRGTAGPRQTTRVEGDGSLSLSPGRVAPRHPAFAANPGTRKEGGRKPLACELEFEGHRLVVIVAHLQSKKADDRLFGWHQPPRRSSEARRRDQALAVNAFVSEILDKSPGTPVIVLGDLNDLGSRPPVVALAGNQLVNLTERLPENDRYTFVYRGNSQALDHILVSHSLAEGAEIDIVHCNSEYPARESASDHDPVVARFSFE